MRKISKERAAQKRAAAAEEMKYLSENFSSTKNITIENAITKLAEAMLILLEQKS